MLELLQGVGAAAPTLGEAAPPPLAAFQLSPGPLPGPIEAGTLGCRICSVRRLQDLERQGGRVDARGL